MGRCLSPSELSSCEKRQMDDQVVQPHLSVLLLLSPIRHASLCVPCTGEGARAQRV